MRLITHPIGVPFEAVHWNHIQIPHVISRHILLGGRDSKTPRKGGSELELALKYYDTNSRRSIDRFFGAIDKLVEKRKLKKLSDGWVIARLQMLMQEDDLNLDENIYLVRVPLFEQLSGSLDGEVSRVAEHILYEIGKREELEVRS